MVKIDVSYKMSRLLYACIFVEILTAIRAYQPSCDPFNQFKFFCFPIQSCSQYSCFDQDCGEVYPFDKLVRIKETKLLPKCAFSNSEDLEYIDGRNTGLKVLASGAFVNLTGNLQIELSFNSIRALHSGTFKNVHAHTLDLSWNKVLYVQEGALLGLPLLKNLNLSRNELSTFPMHELPLQLSVLDFSFNFIDRAILTSKRIPDLTRINLSHNKINKIAVSLDNPVSSIDLSGNRLDKFDLIEVPICEELIIGRNQFREVPEPLTSLNLKKISLYPNPWHCNELRKLWKKLQNNFVTLLEADKLEKEKHPLCTTTTHATLENPLSRISKYCSDDADCDDNLLCRASQCWNPCNYTLCNSGENCEVQQHKPICLCPNGTRLDLRIRYSSCLDVECFTNSDCSLEQYCGINNTCQNDNYGYGGYGGSIGGNSGSYGGSIGGGAGGYGGSIGGDSGGYGQIPQVGGGFISTLDNASTNSPVIFSLSGNGFPPPADDEWWRFEIPETAKEKATGQ